MKTDKIGKWAFLGGLVIAIFAVFAKEIISARIILLILFILGLIVGFLNIAKKNVTEFLVAVIALAVVGSLGAISIGMLEIPVMYAQSMISNFTAFIASAALVVSIRAIIMTSQK